MKLGPYEMEKPVFAAPMAGVTDKAFREIIRSLGGQYVVTEMISDKALLYRNSKTLKMLNLSGEEEPRMVQLFGSEPDLMARAAQMAVEKGATVIDINMGCPTPKIVKNGEGSALLRDIPLAVQIASRVVKSVNVPVTVKTRLGWSVAEITAPELAERLEAVGVRMITVHARTREQFYSGKADWDWIHKIKQKVSIPVIGNGDIFTPRDALEMIERTGCDGVMIGRGILGNPWLIPRTEHYLRTGELPPEPDNLERYRVLLKHFELLLKYKGERIGVNEIRKHAVWYIKGIRNAASYRDEIMKTIEPEKMKEIFTKIFVSEDGKKGSE